MHEGGEHVDTALSRLARSLRNLFERYGNTARLFDEVYRRYGSFMTHTLFPQGVPALRF